MLLMLWLWLLGTKIFFPEIIEKPRYRGTGELLLWLGLPVGIWWEWKEFRTRRFDVILISAGARRYSIITTVSEVTGLDLGRAEALVDARGHPVKEGLEESEAKKIKGRLEAAGAEVELR